MKAVWSIVFGVLAWMSPSSMATSQSPRSKDSTVSFSKKVKQIADSTRILYDSAIVNKRLLNQVIDSAKDGNKPLLQVVQESKRTGRQIDQLAKILSTDKKTKDVEVAVISRVDTISMVYPEIRVDTNWIRGRHPGFFRRLFKRP